MTADPAFGSPLGDHTGLYKVHHSVDRSVATQDVRVFNEMPISSKKCIKTMAKLFYYLFGCQGPSSISGMQEPAKLSTKEGIELFFTLTKVFQSKQVYLKRLVFILLKELATISSDTIIATSSLIHEFNTQHHAADRIDAGYKAGALRALASILQSSMLQSNERLFKQAILDKSPCISSAGIVASYLAWSEGKEVVKRWSNEIGQQLTSGSITQYHALGLMYLIRSNDRISLVKLLGGILNGGISGASSHPAAVMFALRLYVVLVQEGGYAVQRELSGIDLAQFLKFKGRMESVSFEAAKVIYQLDLIQHASPDLLTAAIKALSLYLGGTGRAIHRYASIRLLNLFSIQNAPLVAKYCNSEIEMLITDSNRSIATFAVTTLLKTGTEESVDRLISQIGSLFGDISDEFKIIVVEAIHSLCNKFPSKQATMIEFLLTILRQEGGLPFKQAAVNSVLDLLAGNPKMKESVISSLTEYIEDCEFPQITIQILHLLGNEVSSLSTPSKFIRIIYNRLLLEGPLVRIAATSALFRIGMLSRSSMHHPDSLSQQVMTLLTRSIELDEDDEVRETAQLYFGILKDLSLNSPQQFIPITTASNSELTLPLEEMESKLVEFLSQSKDHSAGPFPFEIETLSLVAREEVEAKESSLGSFQQETFKAAEEVAVVEEKIFSLPEISSLGSRLSRSPSSIWLTERETEYVVSYVKHVFSSAIVFEFVVRNTLEDVSLLDISVEMSHLNESTQDLISPIFSSSIHRLDPSCEDSFFVGYSYDSSLLPIDSSFSCLLIFYSKSFDSGDTSSVISLDCTRDEYQVEDVEINFGDFNRSLSLPPSKSIEQEWESLQLEGWEENETLSLANVSSLQLAVDSLLQIVGNYPIDGSEKVFLPSTPSKSSSPLSHLLVVAIEDVIDSTNRAIIKFNLVQSLQGGGSIYAEVAIRSTSESFSNRIIEVLS